MRYSLLQTAQTSGMIYLILLGAELLKIFMSRGGVPQAAARDDDRISGLSPIRSSILLLIALIVLGCLMDSLSMMLLVDAVLLAGDGRARFRHAAEDTKVWFGILALIVVELGLITPPVGMNVFVINSLAKDVPMSETFKGVFPFFLIELVRVALLVAFPSLSLFLPALLR